VPRHLLHLRDVIIHHVDQNVRMRHQEMDVIDYAVDVSLRDHFPDWHDIGMSREARDADGRDADVSLHHISDLLHRLDERLHPPHDDKLDDSGRRRTDQARVGRHFRHHHSQHRQDHAAHIGHFRMRGTDRGIGRPLIRFVGEVVGLIREPVGLGMRREIIGLVCERLVREIVGLIREIVGLVREIVGLISVVIIGPIRVVIGIIGEVIWLIRRREDHIIVS